MATATIKDVSDFFKTGDPVRDSLKNFKDEWTALDDLSRDYLKSEVAKVIGKA